MEILDLRQLRSKDLAPLLEEEQRIWQSRLHWDYSHTTALILRFVDAQALTGYAAVEGGRAVGYSFFVCEDHKGLIGDAFVSNSFRNGATEVRLMTHVIETLQATPGIRRIEAQLMNFGGEPVRQWFASQGFQSYGRKFMCRGLEDGLPNFPNSNQSHDRQGVVNPDQAPFPTRHPEVEIAGWDPRWFSEAARLITRSYHGHVDSQISDQYRSHVGAMRFLDNIVRYPGCGIFSSSSSFLAFGPSASLPSATLPSTTLRAGRTGGIPSSLCGMVLTSVVRGRVAHITQLCVDPEAQGLGIGSLLMDRVLERLREQDFRAVTLTVTESNQRALRFYERLRFSILNDFHAFVWDAPQEKSWLPGQGGE